ncbi:dsDNA nuclease domain-containing protein [Shewanella decolorationis]|uniref:dsDNA nuclease domain-containing protein n=1 Tax=Shewanella decolorationis TaxID=256839 RepID=UPI001056F01F|nr:dsDNA nuclease domain-containing protein [Shewanella decolorationis]
MLHKVSPREQNGRDSFSRFKAQAKAAAIASLSILDKDGVDRVYCDLHDDFVVRKIGENGVGYIFYQVKTNSKQNHNWTINELFGLLTQKNRIKNQEPKKIRESFIGKMLLHTIVFDIYCNSIVFQTNINTHDDVENLYKDINEGKFENKFTQILLQQFKEIYKEKCSSDISEEDIKKKLSKIKFETDVQHLKLNDDTFESLTRDKIYRFSEIELKYTESKMIIMKLLELIERKSSGTIQELTAESIENKAAVSIDDLLSIMSISKSAYDILVEGGDDKAIKNASIIQRLLESSGASELQIEYCSRSKTSWDLWVRNNRHTIPEFDLQSIFIEVQSALHHLYENGTSINLKDLKKLVTKLYDELNQSDLLFDLNKELLFGALLSEIVRMKS